MRMHRIPIGPMMVGIHELTVDQVRDWLQSLAVPDSAESVDLADVMLFEDEGLRLRDFCRLTDLSSADLGHLTPADLDTLLIKCREVNPRFFLALGRVLALGRMSIQQRLSTASKPLAPRSRGWFARMFTPGPGAG